jgi:hypothetical protein
MIVARIIVHYVVGLTILAGILVLAVLVYTPPTWICVDGFGDQPYTYRGTEPPHMDCRRN